MRGLVGSFQHNPDNWGNSAFDNRNLEIEEGENLKLIAILIPVIVIALLLFAFAIPAIMDGSGMVILSPPFLNPLGVPDVTVSDIQSKENIFLMNVQGVPLCIAGFCSGNNVKICIDGKCQDLGQWSFGPLNAWGGRFSINGIAAGTHNLKVDVYGVPPEGIVNSKSMQISVG